MDFIDNLNVRNFGCSLLLSRTYLHRLTDSSVASEQAKSPVKPPRQIRAFPKVGIYRIRDVFQEMSQCSHPLPSLKACLIQLKYHSHTHTHTHTYTGQILGFHSFQQGASGWCHKARRKGSEECVSLGSDKSDSSPRKWLANALGVQDLA